MNSTDKRQAQKEAFGRLLDIMDDLRAKCPWDMKQTMESIRYLTIEETYELSDAILEKNMEEIKKELGDLALHIVFYSKIASETNDFDVADVMNAICEKLIVRHPHIYADVDAKDENAVRDNWERIKLKEKKDKRLLEGVPNSLPTLVKAIRIQEKARGVGFDWEDKKQVWGKVQEEMEEFHQEAELEKVEGGNQEKMEEEFGDLLFSLVNYARFMDINPETALERTNKKFIKRFNHIEDRGKEDGKPLVEMTLDEMEKYWNEAKGK